MREIFELSAGQLSVRWTVSGQGIALSSIEDRGSGTNGSVPFRVLSSERPFFAVTAVRLPDGTETELRSDMHFPDVSVTEAGDRLEIEARSGEPVPGISVHVTARADAARNRIEYETDVRSENENYAVLCCDYPALWFDVTESARFLSPYGSGEAMKADSERFGHGYGSTQEYPSYGVSFQCMAYWDESRGRMIYYGVEDPAPASKRFSFIRDVGDSALCIKASLPAEHTDRPKNGQKLNGVCVWQLGDGDWYDAVLLYREWMRSNASWIPETDGYGRADSDWLEEIDAWWVVHADKEQFADAVIEGTKELGVRTAVHLYLWHQIPFDNDYPHYFPEKENVRSEIKKMQDAGIRVIPYINGRLWDTRDRGAEDWEFSKKAKPFATKDRNGNVFTESYSSKEADGSPVVLAVMCPSTDFWQDTVKGITDQIFDRIGFDGVYLDQIAAAKPQLCSDPSHDHPAGGGTWWNASYVRLLEKVRDGHPGKVLATECTAEMFMKNIQAYLSWLWVKNDQVPAFPVLYSDLVHLFGVTYGDPSYVDIFIAQSLLYGEQMGWMSPKYYFEKLPHREFYRTAVSARKALHNALSHGRMLRPPVLEDDAPRLHSESCAHAYFKTVDYPAVQGAQWLEKETGSRILILANAGEQDANVRIRTDFPDGLYQPEGSDCGTITVRRGEAHLRMPGLSVAWIRAQGK